MKRFGKYVLIFGMATVVFVLGLMTLHPFVTIQVIGLCLMYRGGVMFLKGWKSLMKDWDKDIETVQNDVLNDDK